MLNHFRDRMVDFQLFRNSTLITTLKGLKNIEANTNKKIIQFKPGTDIQIGDILVNSNIKHYVIDIDVQSWLGTVDSIKAYYQTTPPVEQNSNSTVFNIGTASNSIIGNQQQAILNNSSFDINDLKQLIELYGGNDKEELYELSSQLQQLLNKDDFHKSKLSKFSDLISKHSWLPLAIAQIISAFIQMPH